MGLVLGGGGARGSYEIGVWEALGELSIKPDIVTGTSVGALNGALIVQDDFEAARNIWLNIDNGKILGEGFTDKLKKGDLINNIAAFTREFFENGGADCSCLFELMKKYIDENAVRQSRILFGTVLVEFPSMRPQRVFIDQIPEGRLHHYLMASSACFPAIKAYEMDGKAFVDGGYNDNMPAKMAIERGADEIIAVSLDAPGIMRDLKAIDAVKKGNVRVTVIKSYDHLGEILNFDPETAMKNMRLGYLDTYKALGKLYGFYYSIRKSSLLLDHLASNFDGILTEAGIGEGGDTFGRYAVARSIGKTGRGRLTPTKCIVHALDSAALIYDIDRLKIYSFEELCTLVLEQYKKRGPGLIKSTMLYSVLEKNIQKVTSHAAARLLNFSRHDIVAGFADALERSKSPRDLKGALFMSAALFPAEFEAAVLLTYLGRSSFN